MFISWYEWINSNLPDAQNYKNRLAHGEAGNPGNPEIAAHLAYDAGVRAGLELAAQRLTAVIDPH